MTTTIIIVIYVLLGAAAVRANDEICVYIYYIYIHLSS
jgi:hypothetical protein